jgi:hypothetical protein
MNNLLTMLRNYLHPDFITKGHSQGFTQWLLQSNNPKIGTYLDGFNSSPNLLLAYRLKDRHKALEQLSVDMLVQFERESLQEILDILIREPLADYFWYTYPSNGGQLCYSLPGDEVVPSGALRVDKEKIKPFLRDIKIQSLLDK